MDPGNRRILVYQPVYVGLTALALVVILIAAGWWLYQFGLASAGTELVDIKKQHRALRQQLEKAQRTNSELRQQLAILERSSEIDRLAAQEVRNQFAALNRELLEVGKELDFYRGIVSPQDDKSGLHVQRFELQPANGERRYRFSLMLTQVRRNERYVRGSVDMDIEGVQDGAAGVLPLTEVYVDGKPNLKFKFRYFQEFSGEIEVPEGFEPQRITLRVETSGKGQPPGIEKTVAWPP